MKSLRVLSSRLRALFRREAVLEDIDEELRSHVEMEVQRNIELGLQPQEARRHALKSFGDIGRFRDVAYDIRGGGLLEKLWQDVRLALRLLARNRGFTAIVVLTLALGIGANLSVFSVLNAVMLRPLPYIDSLRFAVIESGNRLKGPDQLGGISPGNFWQMRGELKTFSEVSGLIGSAYSFKDRNNPETVPGMLVTPSFFKALPTAPLIGRVIEERDTCAGCPPVVVLSHRLWMRRFGGDPSIVGKVLYGDDARVIGIMPPDFKYPVACEVWQPLPESLQAQDRSSRYFQVYGLLQPGKKIEDARKELDLLASRLSKDYPRENENLMFAITPFRERLTRDVRRPLLVLMSAVAMVLLMTCANIANLMLVRIAARRRDLALSSALGASHWRLVRQIATEAILLSTAGAVAGLLLAVWARQGLLYLLPGTYAYLPIVDQLRLDWRVYVFGVMAMITSAFLFAVVPALQVARRDAGVLLREGRYSSEGKQTHRLRSVLVVAQVALALVLLTGAGLLINSLLRLERAGVGFDPENLFAVNLRLQPQMSIEQRTQLVRRLGDAVRAVPEAKSVGVTTASVVFPYLRFGLSRSNASKSFDEPVTYDAISPEYFETLGVPVIRGRNFDELESASTEPTAIVNERLARKYFAGEDAIDQLVTLTYLGRPQQRRIVGIVRDFSQGEAGKVEPQIFVPVAQQPWFSAALLVRSGTSPASAIRSIQSALWSIDPDQPVSRLRTAQDLLREKLGEPRLYTALLSLFAVMALLLAAIGLAGVISYSVSQRTREIGVRMALGACEADVLRMIVFRGLKLVALGLLVGLGLSLVVTRLMKGLLFEITATDPQTFAVIVPLLAIIALLACYLPARRATKVEPVIALRSE